MLLRTAPPWPPWLTGRPIVVMALIGGLMGYPPAGGAIAGAGMCLAPLAFAHRAARHVTRGDPPPQLVDPTCTPPMPRGA